MLNLISVFIISKACGSNKHLLFSSCSNGEAVAATLLQNEIHKYTSLVDNRNGLNNYWKQFNSLNVRTDNDPLKWKSSLKDPKLALKYLEPLPCNSSDPLLGCKNEQFTDRDVERLMEVWKKGGTSPRARKLPQQHAEPKAAQRKSTDDNKKRDYKSKLAHFKISEASPVAETATRQTVDNHQNRDFKSTPSNFKSVQALPSPREPETGTNKRQYSNPERAHSSKSNFTFNKKEQRPVEKKEEKPEENRFSGFKTARTALSIQQANKNNRQAPAANNRPQYNNNNRQQQQQQQPVKKSLGGRALNSPFVCPFKEDQSKKEEDEEPAEPTDERLKNIEPKMIELIKNEIMDSGNPISWDDIAGLEHAKQIIKEIVVFPMLRPDIFTGIRRPPKGILLFGPPGTGKTLIGKCIASQSKSTFFSISASSLTSKWIGEGEKMVRALFAVARVEQPSVVFIDEIDSLLCQRSETEHESSRRMKTEFLVQLDGAGTGAEDRILVIGATNRPYELDEAARRRLVKRLYVPLPELEARAQIIRNLMKAERHDLTNEDIYDIATLADGYSGADMTNLCTEASMGPIRSIPFDELEAISKEDVRKVTSEDFKEALNAVRPSVSQKDLMVYLDWDRTYGTASTQART